MTACGWSSVCNDCELDLAHWAAYGRPFILSALLCEGDNSDYISFGKCELEGNHEFFGLDRI